MMIVAGLYFLGGAAPCFARNVNRESTLYVNIVVCQVCVFIYRYVTKQFCFKVTD